MAVFTCPRLHAEAGVSYNYLPAGCSMCNRFLCLCCTSGIQWAAPPPSPIPLTYLLPEAAQMIFGFIVILSTLWPITSRWHMLLCPCFAVGWGYYLFMTWPTPRHLQGAPPPRRSSYSLTSSTFSGGGSFAFNMTHWNPWYWPTSLQVVKFILLGLASQRYSRYLWCYGSLLPVDTCRDQRVLLMKPCRIHRSPSLPFREEGGFTFLKLYHRWEYSILRIVRVCSHLYHVERSLHTMTTKLSHYNAKDNRYILHLLWPFIWLPEPPGGHVCPMRQLELKLICFSHQWVISCWDRRRR